MNSYVTLVANEDYLLGAKALAKSLTMCKSEAPLRVLAPQHIDGIDELEALGCIIIDVDPLPFSDAFRTRHSRQSQHKQAPFTKGTKPKFHDPLLNFAKLRLWEMDQFERIIFLDADTVVIQNIDHLFGYPEFSAAPNVYESLADFHRLNSGVFVAEPNRATFENMLETLDQPDVFWRRTDQTFLQAYYPQWHGLPYIYNTLQYVWFNLPELWRWESIYVVHYQYEKPWQTDHPKQQQLQPLIDLWASILETGTLPDHLENPLKEHLT